MIIIKKFVRKLLGLDFYVSHTDQFLANFDNSHPGHSHSQHKEIEKSGRIAKLRDHAETPVQQNKFWDKF